MQVVITGAAGFLGVALRHALLAFEQIEVMGISRRPFPGLLTVPNYAETPSGDVLVHLAESNDRQIANSDGQVYETAAINLLETLGNKGFKRIVYASSAVLYGDQNTSPCKENDPVYLTDPYTRIKHACEEWVIRHGGIVARLSNLYGPGMAEKNVLSTILNQLPNSGPITVHDLTPVRDFLWIEDAARALAIMSMSQKSDIFNIGSGAGRSILQLANTALEAAGQGGRAVLSKVEGDSRSHLVLNTTQASSQLGWQPITTLQQGMLSLLNVNKYRIK
jgi:UDP-glucose 4-epimerase